MRQLNVLIGNVYNNGELCANPVVEYSGNRGVALPCIDTVNGIYSLEIPDDQSTEACLVFIVSCGDCHECPPIVKEICFCDNESNCPDCHYCDVNGQCISECDFGQVCVNDSCHDCLDDDDCPCNQKCNGNGKCECPVGTTLNGVTGCCDNCSVDNDCPACYICDNGTCVPKDCAGGKCDETNISGFGAGTCVGCLIDSDCTGANECCNDTTFECECCDKFTRVNGTCVPAPECTSNADCKAISPCLSCQNGNCLPQKCAPGETPVVVGGICICYKICVDCQPGSCDNGFYCSAVSSNVCACLPCSGDCANGCEDPCYCSDSVGGCIENPCVNTTCTNGVECGPNCGCLNGQCVPCETLSCSGTQCATALGCGCIGNSCTSLGCNQTDCSSEIDCGPGCTCVNGQCVHCSNFTCSGNDCSNQPGCGCNSSGDCVDSEDACIDSLTITKDDANCQMTGKLVSQQECNCSPMTLDVKGKINSSDSENYNITFLAEVRKGSYNGVDPDANPLVDDYSNDNIAENEPPISGVVELRATVTWALYEQNQDEPTVYDYVGQSTDQPIIKTVGFPSTGDVSSVEFSAFNLPKIGVRIQSSETTQKEAVFITIKHTHTGTMNFPNQCSYLGGTVIGTHSISSDSDWNKFGSTFTNPVATTVQSSVLRYPLFKWSKDGVVVRKAYIPGDGTYEDVIARPPYDWLESCSTYVLETDCSCEKNTSKKVTFCKPDGIVFELTACNKKFKLTSFSTCTPNYDQDFYIKGGDIDLTFKGQFPPIGVVYESETCIDEIRFGLACDDACEVLYSSPCPEYDVTLDTECDPGNQTFTITIPSTTTDGTPITQVTMGQYVLTPGSTSNIAVGQYTAQVYVQGGCDYFEVEVTQHCCSGSISPISRDCEGGVICTQDIGVTYELEDGTPIGDVCAYVNALPAESGATIIATKEGCSSVTFVLQPLSSFCCENFNYDIIELSRDRALISVYNAQGDVSISVVPQSNGDTPVITALGDNQFQVDGATGGQTYIITITDDLCGTIQGTWVPGVCDLIVTVEETDDCGLRAYVNDQSCDCGLGKWNIEITDVIDRGTQYEVFYEYSLSQLDANPVGGGLYYEFEGTEYFLTALSLAGSSGSFFIDIPENTIEPECIPAYITATLIDDPVNGPCESGINCQSVVAQVYLDGINITAHPGVDSYSLFAQDLNNGINQTINSPVLGGIFTFTGLIQGPVSGTTPVRFIISVTIDGTEYTGTISEAMVSELTPLNFTVPNGVCTESGTDIGDAVVRFKTKDLALENNCSYVDEGHNFKIFGDGQWTKKGVVSITLQDVANTAQTKFTWYDEVNGEIFSEFADSESILPEVYLEQGRNYEVKADCSPCSDVAEIQLTCLPDLTFDIPGYNERLDITATGEPGSYTVTVGASSYALTIDGSGTGTVVHPGPLTPDTTLSVTVFVSGIPGVKEYEVPTDPSYTAEFTATACDTATNTYGIVITNAGPGYTTTINSGTGSVAANGYDIVGVSEADPVNFTVTHPEGATSGPWLGTPLASCFVSSSDAPASSSVPTTPPASSSLVPGGSSSVPAASSSAVPVSSNVAASSLPNSSSNVPAASSSATPASSSLPNSSSNVAASSPSLSSSSGVIPASSSPTVVASSSAAAAGSDCGCTYTGQACGTCGTCVGVGGGVYLCERIDYGDPCSGIPGSVCTQAPISGCWDCQLPT